MKKKYFPPVVWLLAVALMNLLSLCLAVAYTPTFWITYVFCWVALFSVLVLWLVYMKRQTGLEEKFFSFPALTVSLGYLLAQLILCVVFSLGAESISTKVTILVNTLVAIIAWGLIALVLIAKGNIHENEQRQKDHHTIL